jgi:hypothetical protein
VADDRGATRWRRRLARFQRFGFTEAVLHARRCVTYGRRCVEPFTFSAFAWWGLGRPFVFAFAIVFIPSSSLIYAARLW